MSFELTAGGAVWASRELLRQARRRALLELPVKARDTADLIDHLDVRARIAGVAPPERLHLPTVASELRGWAHTQELRNFEASA